MIGRAVVLLRVWPTLELQTTVDREQIARSLEPARNELTAAGVQARVEVGIGYPADVILDAVDAEQADLVAITTHGRSGAARWFMGSVTEKVLRRCPAPLLVVNTRPMEDAD